MAANTKRTVSTRNEKEKNHAPTPPSLVVEPPRPDEILGKKYETGALLGKGGFAICHQAKLVGSKYGSTNQLYALKIVRANLGSKRLEEKVPYQGLARILQILTGPSFAPSCRFTLK